MGHGGWGKKVLATQTSHFVIIMMEKQNYMYSEKSDGCMNSCIVDNSLVCGML